MGRTFQKYRTCGSRTLLPPTTTQSLDSTRRLKVCCGIGTKTLAAVAEGRGLHGSDLTVQHLLQMLSGPEIGMSLLSPFLLSTTADQEHHQDLQLWNCSDPVLTVTVQTFSNVCWSFCYFHHVSLCRLYPAQWKAPVSWRNPSYHQDATADPCILQSFFSSWHFWMWLQYDGGLNTWTLLLPRLPPNNNWCFKPPFEPPTTFFCLFSTKSSWSKA